jgi:hypothetical protein
MQNTTFTAAVTDHADFDPIALWASLSNEWDALPDLMLDMGNVADADFFEEMADAARWMVGTLITDALIAT